MSTTTSTSTSTATADMTREQLEAYFRGDLITGIVTALSAKDPGSDWRISEWDDCGRYWVRLQNRMTANDRAPEKMRISLDTHSRRLSVYGSYGQSLNGQQWVPSYNMPRGTVDPQPTMSIDKRTPEQIAADISRRLLPGYRVNLAEYRRQLVASLQQRESTHALAVQLIADGNGRLKPWGSAWDAKDPRTLSAHVEYQSIVGVSHGEVEVSGADSVQVKLTVDRERARQLVAWLAEQPRVAPAAAESEGE